MITDTHAERFEKINTDPTTEFERIASEHHIALSKDRIAKLTRTADYFKDLYEKGEDHGYEDTEHGIYIGIPGGRLLHSDDTETRIDGVSQIDFIPTSSDQIDSFMSTSRLVDPTPEQITHITHHGIRGLQDYLILVEAGYIKAPRELYGETNPRMARVAERVGLSPKGEAWSIFDAEMNVILTAPLETVREQVFSERIRRMDETISKRLLGSASLHKVA